MSQNVFSRLFRLILDVIEEEPFEIDFSAHIVTRRDTISVGNDC